MDREVKIILGLIILLIGVVLSLVLATGNIDDTNNLITEDEWTSLKNGENENQFVDSSSWLSYASEEYAYEMKYPSEWEFNLIDGTTFHPELCARNKYDKCVGRVSVGVYPEIDENDEVVDLQKKCSNVSKATMRHINGDVWVCEEFMSDEFTVAQGYDQKKEYYFTDNRGSIFEVDIMYLKGESIRTAEEMVQTIKLRAK